MFPAHLTAEAEALLEPLRKAKWKIATAESCTGGLIAALFTSIPGVSNVFERGFVTYSNEAKQESLGVPASEIEEHGAVSPEVAACMAQGALERSHADLAVSVTGIAGPTGGGEHKPVGLVYLACAVKGRGTLIEKHIFPGNRQDIQLASVRQSLALIRHALD